MKKFFAVLAAVCLVLGTSGCQQNDDVSTGQDVRDSVEIAEMKTIEPPENGWTAEELSDIIYINGVNYDYPISLKDLGKDFSSDESFILYKNQEAFGGSVNDNGIYNSLSFSVSSNYSELPNQSLININGVTLESNKEDLLLKMGESISTTENDLTRMIYGTENLKVVFILNEEEKVSFVSLLWEE